MAWLFGIAGAALLALGFGAARWLTRRAVVSAILDRKVDTSSAEHDAEQHEHDAADKKADTVLRSSSDELRKRVEEMRARGRAPK